MASNIVKIAARITRLNVPSAAHRQIISRNTSTLKPSVKQDMERFSLEDGVPIFKKNGSVDNILYRLTMGLCVASLGVIFANFYKFGFKK